MNIVDSSVFYLYTRPFYLNQSKSSISVSMVIMITLVIQICYGVQRFKPDVSTSNMHENIAIWNLLIYKTNEYSRLIGFLLIYKTILFTYIQDHFISLYTRPFYFLIYKTILFPYIQDHFISLYTRPFYFLIYKTIRPAENQIYNIYYICLSRHY